MTLKLEELLHSFHGISLEELSRASLMNRTDEKFAFLLSDLPDLLSHLRSYYDVLNIEGKVIFSYTSQYFDAPDFRFFNDHHNAVPNRFKVRIRTYLDSAISFLEVKEKWKERTNKRRIPASGFTEKFDEASAAFVQDLLGENIDLKPVLINSYERITLVNKHSEERLTIDLNVTNHSVHAGKETRQTLEQIVIAELKQPKIDRNSPFFRLMRSKNIRPFRISKFCFGVMDVYENDLKSNRFKPKRLFIQKLLSNVPAHNRA